MARFQQLTTEQTQHDAEAAELDRWQAIDATLGQMNLAQPYTKPGSDSAIESVLQLFGDRIAEVLGPDNVSVQMSDPLDFTVSGASVRAVRAYLAEVARDELELRRRQDGTAARHTGSLAYPEVATDTPARKAARQRGQENAWVSEIETPQAYDNEAGNRMINMLAVGFGLPLTVISAQGTADAGPNPANGSARGAVTVQGSYYQSAVPGTG